MRRPGEPCHETCIKIEPVTVVPYLLPALTTGQSYSKVILKPVSTGNSVTNENTIYVVPGTSGYPDAIVGHLVPGTPVEHAEKDSISHIILCTVPTPTPPATQNDAVVGVASVTPATCDVAGTLVLAAGIHASWGAVTYSGDGDLHYSVTATAEPGHTFADGSATVLVTGTLAAALTGDQCDPTTVHRDAVAGEVTTTAATCDVAQTLVLGAGTYASWGAVTYSGEGNLHYTVTATAAAGHAFVDGSTTFVVTGTLAGALTSAQLYQGAPDRCQGCGSRCRDDDGCDV